MTVHPGFTTIATRAAGDPDGLNQLCIIRYYYGQVAWKFLSDLGDARPFTEIAPDVHRFLHEQIVVEWGPTARESIEAAFKASGLDCPEARWLDCQKVAQRVWPECCTEDYALSAVAHRIRYRYQPFSTIDDAKAIGAVLIEAIAESGYSAEEWVPIVKGGEN